MEWLSVCDLQDAMAQKKGVAPAQLALAYIMNLYDKVRKWCLQMWTLSRLESAVLTATLSPQSIQLIPIPGSSSVNRTLENIEAANVKFAPGEFEEIHKSIQQVSRSRSRLLCLLYTPAYTAVT